jgi:TolB protein
MARDSRVPSVPAMRRTALTTTLALTLVALTAATAHATFPGHNGLITYRAGAIPVPPGTYWPLFSMRPDGTGERLLSPEVGYLQDVRADGRRLAYDFFPEGSADEQIATSRPDGSDRHVITSGPGIHEGPSWSPDGNRIAWDYSPLSDPNDPAFSTRLYTMRPDGSQPRPLALRDPGFDVVPRYSPNGRWIAFVRISIQPDGDDHQALFITGAHGGEVHRLTRWSDDAENHSWSPDSRWIAYDTPRFGDLQAVRPDGSAHRALLTHTETMSVHKPVFSPDGRKLLFMCAFHGPGGDDDLCTIERDGTGFTNLTNTPTRGENGPGWAPAPR